MNKGFTILELVVSIAIFAFMTAFTVAKYGTFNQGVILTNLAYDVALTIRNAQSYGLNVKSSGRETNEFSKPYGVYFLKGSSSFIFFVDSNNDGLFNTADPDRPGGLSESLSTSNIKNGSTISLITTIDNQGNSNTSVEGLHITFKRPDPNAIIKANADVNKNYREATITISAVDGTKRSVVVRSNGYISVI